MEHKLSLDELIFILEGVEARINDQRNRVASLDLADPQLPGQHAVLRTLCSLSGRLRAFRDAALADRLTTHSTDRYKPRPPHIMAPCTRTPLGTAKH